MLGVLKEAKLLGSRTIKSWPLIYALSVREIKVRYKGSVLGFFWTFVNPLITVVVYFLIFKHLFRVQVENYPILVLAGQLLWSLIASCLNDGAVTMVANSNLITKSALPPEILPMRVVLSGFLNYFLSLLIFFPASFVLGSMSVFGPTLIQLLVFFPLCFALMYSIVLGLSVLGAVFRDIPHIVSSLLFVLYFAAPVMYPFELLPMHLRSVLIYVPTTTIVEMGSSIFVKGAWIDGKVIMISIVQIALLTIVSLLIFRRYRSKIAERV